LERGTYFGVPILAEQLAHCLGDGFNKAFFVHDIRKADHVPLVLSPAGV
jgi:hypothetical protein